MSNIRKILFAAVVVGALFCSACGKKSSTKVEVPAAAATPEVGWKEFSTDNWKFQFPDIENNAFLRSQFLPTEPPEWWADQLLTRAGRNGLSIPLQYEFIEEPCSVTVDGMTNLPNFKSLVSAVAKPIFFVERLVDRPSGKASLQWFGYKRSETDCLLLKISTVSMQKEFNSTADNTDAARTILKVAKSVRQ